MQRENVKAFIDGVRAIGLKEQYNFDTEDLFEAKNMKQVVICLLSLARHAYSLPEYTGPCFGVKENDKVGKHEKMRHNSVDGDGLWGKVGGKHKAADNKNLGH